MGVLSESMNTGELNAELLSVRAELESTKLSLVESDKNLEQVRVRLAEQCTLGDQVLKERDLYLRHLVMTAGYALVILKGPEWIIEVANQQLAQLWQKSLDEIIGKKLMDVLPEIAGQPFPDLLKQVYETGRGYKKEEEVFLLDSPSGQIKKYVSFSYDPLKDTSGFITGIIVSSRDITETVMARLMLQESYNQQQALNETITATNKDLANAIWSLTNSNEELSRTQKRLVKKVAQLADSEARIRYMLEESPVAMGILSGRDLIIEAANNRVLQIWGKERSIIGKRLVKALPEIKDQFFLGVLDEVFTSGIPYHGNEALAQLEQNGVLKDVYLNFVYQPIKNEQGQTTSIIVVASDITEQVKARSVIAENNKMLRQALIEFEFLANTVPCVVWTARSNGLLDYINQRWYDHSDIPIENSLGEGWTLSVHPDDLPQASEAWAHAVKTGNLYQIEFRLLDKWGKYRWYLVRALPLKEDDGEIRKWYGTNTDISEQKELQRQKDDFMGIASHELKTPVTSIKAYAQLMEVKFEQAGDKENRLLAEKMDKQVNRLTSLIGDLLDVTKINSGRIQFNNTVFDFNQLVEEVIEDIAQTSGRHVIEKKLEFKGRVAGDRDRIWQVVTNLLTNATKYSPDANRIIVYSENKGDNVQFCVQDFGIGIKKEKSDRVFEQFYRVSGTREHTFPGLGLGLYISSEIVKRLGGRIWVDSVEGKGSTFCFTIPSISDEEA